MWFKKILIYAHVAIREKKLIIHTEKKSLDYYRGRKILRIECQLPVQLEWLTKG